MSKPAQDPTGLMMRSVFAFAALALIVGTTALKASADWKSGGPAVASRVADAGQEPVSITFTEVVAEGEGEGRVLGTVKATQLVRGVLFEPALKHLEPGLHGFHLYDEAQCGPQLTEEQAAEDASPGEDIGEHWDPGFKGNHAGPWHHGHRGDLPNLYADSDGAALLPLYAPRLTLRDLEERTLIIRAQGDNYQEEPDPNGGGGRAVACGART